MNESRAQHKKRALTSRQIAAVSAVVALVAVVLVTYGAAGSYDGLWHLAAARHVPLPRLVPAGLDGGLIGVIALDITLTWAGRPLAWLRFAARAFALGTVTANAAAGWPDPVAVFLRVFAPALIVVITEAIRTVLLDRAREDRDPVPLARWILAPVPTFRLWRRMVLWRVRDYGTAVDMEISRRQAAVRLAGRYGKEWRKAAPADLVWALRNGVRMGETLAAVAVLTAPPAALPAPLRKRVPVKRSRRSAPLPGRVPRGAPVSDLTLEARALEVLATDLDMSGAELARTLGVSPSYGRKLRSRLTSPDAAARG